MMKKLIFMLLISLFRVELIFAQEVSPFDQCRNYVTIIAKEKDKSQLDLSLYMAKVEVLEREKAALEERIKTLEIKKKDVSGESTDDTLDNILKEVK